MSTMITNFTVPGPGSPTAPNLTWEKPLCWVGQEIRPCGQQHCMDVVDSELPGSGPEISLHFFVAPLSC